MPSKNLEMEKIFLLTFCLFSSAFASFLEVDYPNVNVSAESRGDAIFEAGDGGNVFLEPGTGGTVYIGSTDLRKFIQRVKSLPPVWTKQSEHGTLGTFLSGEQLSVNVEAIDPDGSDVYYSLISGQLPPGTKLNVSTGFIEGQAPDVDATYTFGIRATDTHGKFADGVFSIDIREKDQCSSNPCMNGGRCTDDIGKFKCTCPVSHGGDTCQIECKLNPFGVGTANTQIPDAQISGHLTYSTYNPWDGRLGSGNGWIGNDMGSWLQVDLGEERYVYAVVTQGYKSSTYYISTFEVSVSINGNSFMYVRSKGSQTFNGSANYDQIIVHQLDSRVRARFVRFIPKTWHAGGHPGLRVEVFGCPI